MATDASAQGSRVTGLLVGDTALVTGAASGIGRGIARALAREGARLVLTDVLPEAGAAVAAETGGTFIAADLAQPTAFQDVVDATLATLGSISVFVHCAAPPRREDQTALAVSAEQWDEMVSITLRSGFLLGQAVGRHMRDGGLRGRMLYLTSLHARTPRNLPHYSASKAGQTMVVLELARALGPHGIRVNAIAPGAIPGGGFAADVAALEAKIAMGRTGTPEDIAGMAVALLSDRFSAYVTGTTVVVDGGLALHNWIDPS
ncbi:MAG: SDR family NAD(P)-dependent oxidoreductase [Janthinobacterium lividum]